MKAYYLNEFRVIPIDFDSDDIRYGTYILITGNKILHDKVKREKISEEEGILQWRKRMIWLSYSSVRRYDKSTWMRSRVTNILSALRRISLLENSNGYYVLYLSVNLIRLLE